MDTHESEQALRREAIRRHLQGEPRNRICADLGRSPRWFDKWWHIYQLEPQSNLSDCSRAPRTSPHAMPPAVSEAVVAVRQILEEAATAETRYGLIGAASIQTQLARLRITPLPSVATIQRILAAHELTHSLGAGSDAAYYPWPVAWEVNAIHALDIITRHVHGGEEIQNFHTIDLFSQAVYLTRQSDKTSATTCAHLQKTWAKLGLPQVQQFDNEGAFCGGHTHPHVIGQVVRLCLFCGIEPFFIPIYEAKRNYQIESFHSLWVRGFWSRFDFADRAQVDAEAPLYEHWYHTVYQPPALDGRTPAQVRRGVAVVRLTPDVRKLIPTSPLPITTGRIHIMRKVDPLGEITLLNETWPVGHQWIGEYVRATINTARQTLTFWHQTDADRPWRLIKTRQFRLQESVHDVLPAFRRKCARCRDCWPG
jgi:hypothetical protein